MNAVLGGIARQLSLDRDALNIRLLVLPVLLPACYIPSVNLVIYHHIYLVVKLGSVGEATTSLGKIRSSFFEQRKRKACKLHKAIHENGSNVQSPMEDGPLTILLYSLS